MSQRTIDPKHLTTKHETRAPATQRSRLYNLLRCIAKSPLTLTIACLLAEAARLWCQSRYPAWAEWIQEVIKMLKR